MKLHFGYLLGLSALFIAGCAAYFSVFGIGKLFAGATTSVIIMASALEFGKIITASYLERYWGKISYLMRTYYIIGLLVLISITSAGIYGFLSSAYQETFQKLTINENEIKFLKQKERFYGDDVARYDEELKRISESISELSNTKVNSIQVRDENSETGFRNTISTSGLRIAQERISIEEVNRKNVMEKRNIVSDSLQKYQLAILTKENDSEISGELGPLKYVAELTNTPMDEVVNYFILLLIFVFDPLAITLIIATNSVFREENEHKLKSEPIKKQPIKQEPIKKQPIKQETIKEEPIKEEVVKEEVVKEGVVKQEPIKTSGVTPEDIVSVRKNARNITRSIPARRGF